MLGLQLGSGCNSLTTEGLVLPLVDEQSTSAMSFKVET